MSNYIQFELFLIICIDHYCSYLKKNEIKWFNSRKCIKFIFNLLFIKSIIR